MSALTVAIGEINGFLSRHRWRYCLVGGVALSRVGQPRTTEDVDLCLLTGLEHTAEFSGLLLQEFRGRIASPAEFAEINRVLLIEASNHVGIDIALGWTPFEERMISRAKPFRLAPNVVVPTASAEDMIVTKAFAARPQDWIDVEGILERQRGKLDWSCVLAELRPLSELKEAPEIVDQLLQLRAKVDPE
jgi:hypothetical protein